MSIIGSFISLFEGATGVSVSNSFVNTDADGNVSSIGIEYQGDLNVDELNSGIGPEYSAHSHWYHDDVIHIDKNG